jgi:2,3-dihydroxybenzoate-AMP ligase
MDAPVRNAGVRHPMRGVTYLPQADIVRYGAAGVLLDVTLSSAFDAACVEHANRTALTGPEGRLTYHELAQRSDRLAVAMLDTLRLRPLDRVLFQLDNCQSLIVAVIACWKANLIPVCTIAAHREHEIIQLAELSEARAHILQADSARFDLLAFARSLAPRLPTVRWRILASQRSWRSRWARKQSVIDASREATVDALIASIDAGYARTRLQALERDPYQVGVFQLSGGTTGTPKIIPRFHNEYVYQMRQVAKALAWGVEDTIYMPLPMMHNANMGCGWGPALLSGAQVVITPMVSPQVFAKVMLAKRPTWLVAAKPILMRLKDSPVAKVLPFGSLRGVISTDAAPLVRQVMRAPGFHIFGMTEGTIMYTRRDDPIEALDKTVGYPISSYDEVRLLEPGTEREVTAGSIGELAVRGPYTTRGYYNAPERNIEAFTSDGFYRSGDLMCARKIAGKTYYSFEGRIKDVIDRGSEKINCEEVERALAEHPAISDVALVAMPDPVFGQRGCAFVVTRPGQPAPSVQSLGDYLQRYGLAKFKWPERVEIIAALPVTKIGKLDKQALRAQIAKLLGGESA